MSFHFSILNIQGELFSTHYGWLLLVEIHANAHICGLCPESNACQRCPKLGHIIRTAELKIPQFCGRYEWTKKVISRCRSSLLMAKIISFLDIFTTKKNTILRIPNGKNDLLQWLCVWFWKTSSWKCVLKQISSKFGTLLLEEKCISGLCHVIEKFMKIEHTIADSTI